MPNETVQSYMTDHAAAVEEMVRKYDAKEVGWTPVSADIALHFLEAMPPIYVQGVPGAFAMSECYDHGRKGERLYFCFYGHFLNSESAYGRICTVDELQDKAQAERATKRVSSAA